MNGIARRVKFQVHGNKISYRGTLGNTRLRKGTLPFLKMDVYVGGRIKDQNYDTANGGRGGDVEFYYTNLCMRTQDGMDLSKFNPIFYSKGRDVTEGKTNQGQKQDYYSTGHKFKLFGEFVSFNFRMANGGGVSAKFNGVLLRGFGRGGATLVGPTKTNGNKPYMEVTTSSASLTNDGYFITFSDNKTYTIKGDGSLPVDVQTGVSEDPAYTLYLLTDVENQGGFRMGLNNARSTIFLNNTGKNNLPNYWQKSGTQLYSSKSANRGKFHNLHLILRTK